MDELNYVRLEKRIERFLRENPYYEISQVFEKGEGKIIVFAIKNKPSLSFRLLFKDNQTIQITYVGNIPSKKKIVYEVRANRFDINNMHATILEFEKQLSHKTK